MTTEITFPFLDPGPLTDGELRLVLTETRQGKGEKGIVPEYKFQMQHKSGTVAGSIGFRIRLNAKLENYGGHIGYEVRPEFRGSYYAARSCRLLLPLARRHGVERLLLTCDPENLASRKTIESVGGRLSRIGKAMIEAGEYRDTCYYHIDLQVNPDES